MTAYDYTFLQPIRTSDLVRVGRLHDGGYVVNSRILSGTDIVIGIGISTDWSFEEHFYQLTHQRVEVYCYDFSVSKEDLRRKFVSSAVDMFSLRFFYHLLRMNTRLLTRLRENWNLYRSFSKFFSGRIHFIHSGVSNCRSDGWILFEDIFDDIPHPVRPHSIFLKIDIELSEFRILDDVLRFEKYFNGIAIEFHELDIMWERFVGCVGKLKEHFFITHVHGNNFRGLIPNTNVPSALEITLIHKSNFPTSAVENSLAEYPLEKVDYPNDPLQPDHRLSFNNRK